MSLWIEAGAECALLVGPYAVLVLYAVLRRRRKNRVGLDLYRDGKTWRKL